MPLEKPLPQRQRLRSFLVSMHLSHGFAKERMRLPNFVIAGVPKAGTSSVHRWISEHPRVTGSFEKETCFFADPGSHMYRGHSTDLEAYARCFPPDAGVQTDVLMESGPAYVYSAKALNDLPSLPSQPKCLFIVREPSAQIYSLFRYFRNNWSWIPAGMTFRSFVEAARTGTHAFGGNELAQNALKNGEYVDFLERWRERLGARMQVRTFDELLRDHLDFTRSIARWLGLDPAFYDRYGFPRENESYHVRNAPLQKLNIALRGRLPKGRLYDALRRGYRRLNTAAPSKPSDDDLQVLAELRETFREANARLSRSFNLDLSVWQARE